MNPHETKAMEMMCEACYAARDYKDPGLKASRIAKEINLASLLQAQDELATVLGSPTLKLAAECAKARQSEIDSLKAQLAATQNEFDIEHGAICEIGRKVFNDDKDAFNCVPVKVATIKALELFRQLNTASSLAYNAYQGGDPARLREAMNGLFDALDSIIKAKIL